MHVTVNLPHGLHDVEIAVRAAKEKLWLWPLSSSYWSTNSVARIHPSALEAHRRIRSRSGFDNCGRSSRAHDWCASRPRPVKSGGILNFVSDRQSRSGFASSSRNNRIAAITAARLRRIEPHWQASPRPARGPGVRAAQPVGALLGRPLRALQAPCREDSIRPAEVFRRLGRTAQK